MNKIYSSLLALFVVSDIHAQTVIAAETFENAAPLFTISGGGTAFLSGSSVAPVQPAGASYATQGTYGLSITGNNTATLTSGAINTSGFTNLQITLRVAAFGLVAGSVGVDQIDRLRIAISIDGGSFFSDMLYVTGAATNQSFWPFSATGNATTAYPTSVTFNAPNSGLNPAGYSTMTITNLPSQADLRVRIVGNVSINNERWVIDDFQLTGMLSLPITLLSFNSRFESNQPFIKWEIAAPVDGFLYELQRSNDGNHFTTVNKQTGDELKTSFSYLDPTTGQDLYYKLKMTDIDGKITYSTILHVVSSGNNNKVALLYPNIVRDKATLRLNDNNIRGLTAKLINMNGATVKTFRISTNFELIDMAGIASGIYVLKLSDGTTFRLLKE